MGRKPSNALAIVSWWVRLAALAVAVGAWFAPMPSAWVTRLYPERLYPALQSVLTRASNLAPIALLDLSILAVLVALAWGVRRVVRKMTPGRRVAAAASGVMSLAAVAAVAYLWFLGAWGMNYRRTPVSATVDFAAERLTVAAARAWAVRAVDALNAGHGEARRDRLDDWDEVASILVEPFAAVQRDLGHARPALAGRPKRSLVALAFEPAGVSGMTDPWWLEVIPDPAALPVERPAILAHEWAHLAGYADEGDASFVGWLVAGRAGGKARYSAWLAVIGQLLAALPPRDREAVAGRLAAGPRNDLRAIAARAGRAWPPLRRAAWRTYDRYLRAQSVEEGVASYRGVTRLLVGTRFVGEWRVALARHRG